MSPGQRRRLKERRVDLVPARIRVTIPTPASSRIDMLCWARNNGDIRHGAAIRHSDPVHTYIEEQIDK